MRTQMIWFSMVWLAMAGGSAAAQGTADRAVAEQLFQEGRTLMKQGDFAAACPKLEASFALDPALGTELNLAACYEKIDRLASAWAHYRAVEDRATQAGQPSRVATARARAAAVEPRVPRLVVRVPAEARIPGLAVMRDDTALAQALFDTPLYVDAGEHRVHATAPGRQPFTQAVRVATGEAQVIEVPLLAAPVAEPAPPGPGVRPPERPRRVPGQPGGTEAPGGSSGLGPERVDASPAGSRRRTLAWVTGGTGAAALALGLGLGWSAKQVWTDGGVPVCDPETWQCDDADDLTRLESARARARAASIAVGSGVALMAAGAVLYWTAPDLDHGARGARVVPTAGASGLGLAVMGRF